MKVGLVMDPSLKKRGRTLDSPTWQQVLQRAVVLVTEELNNGPRHQKAREETDVDDDVGAAYNDAIYHNRFKRDTATDRVLRAILAREELRP